MTQTITAKILLQSTYSDMQNNNSSVNSNQNILAVHHIDVHIHIHTPMAQPLGAIWGSVPCLRTLQHVNWRSWNRAANLLISGRPPEPLPFFCFLFCTENVPNRDPKTEVHTQPWILCTVTRLVDKHLSWHRYLSFSATYTEWVCWNSLLYSPLNPWPFGKLLCCPRTIK